MRKIRILLGAYVNYVNAQNINCDNIAKYLDKNKFEVHVFYMTRVPVDKKPYLDAGIHLHKLVHHRFIWYWSKWLVMKRGKYDIYYLPKFEPTDIRFAEKYKDKYCFISSIEGVVTEETAKENKRAYFYCKLMDSSFSISKCIRESVCKWWGMDTQVLSLGTVPFDKGDITKREIRNIVWIGNINYNKRPFYYIECAKAFPDLNFLMIGTGELEDEVKQYINENQMYNISLIGRISNAKVYDYFLQSDLLLMTSENEGVPKVIQEAAQCGVPSIYLANNYRVDFIENGISGYEAYSLYEMREEIKYLLEHLDVYRNMSETVKMRADNFTWPSLIGDYEEYFMETYKKKKGLV